MVVACVNKCLRHFFRHFFTRQQPQFLFLFFYISIFDIQHSPGLIVKLCKNQSTFWRTPKGSLCDVLLMSTTTSSRPLPPPHVHYQLLTSTTTSSRPLPSPHVHYHLLTSTATSSHFENHFMNKILYKFKKCLVHANMRNCIPV